MERLHRPPVTRRILAPNGAARLLVELDPVDLHRYAAAVASTVPSIERTLGPGVLANRTGPRRPARPRADWDRWITRCAARADAYVLRADVRRCYRSIGSDTVDAALRSVGIRAGDRDEVERFLVATRTAGIDGLPVGPAPSAVLANAVLAIADDAIRREGVVHRRWVDDVVLTGEPALVRRAFVAWRSTLRELGLREHPDKHDEGPAERVLACARSCGSGAMP